MSGNICSDRRLHLCLYLSAGSHLQFFFPSFFLASCHPKCRRGKASRPSLAKPGLVPGPGESPALGASPAARHVGLLQMSVLGALGAAARVHADGSRGRTDGQPTSASSMGFSWVHWGKIWGFFFLTPCYKQGFLEAISLLFCSLTHPLLVPCSSPHPQGLSSPQRATPQ